MNFNKALALLVCSVLLTACGVLTYETIGPWDFPTDLKLESMELTNTQTVDEYAQERSQYPKSWYAQDHKLLRINFSSETNFDSLATDEWDPYNVYSVVNMGCRSESKRGWNQSNIETASDIFWKGYAIEVDHHIANSNTATDNRMVYSIFIPTEARAKESTIYTEPPYQSYDLFENPQDICFFIVSAQYFNSVDQSNTIRIPKETIQSILTSKKNTLQ